MALTRATDKIIGDSNGNLNLSGIVTATRFSGPLVPSGDLNVGSSIKLGSASGIVTATLFSGSGANLTGVASTENINTSTVANFTGGIQVGGATTLTGALTGTTASFSGDVGIGGTLTYEDVTNIDSVGVITARSGINLTGGVINSAGNINCTSGRFQRGSSTIQDGDAIAGGININGLDMDASVIMSVFGNDGDFTRISGSKSRNASVGSHTIVQDNDVLLSLKGFGSDGTNFEEAAQVEMQVDGTPGNNSMPGRIVFKTTTTDGVAERLRITSGGNILTQGLTGPSFDNQGANGTKYEFTGAGTAGKFSVINVSGNSNTDGGTIGVLRFVNRENANSSSGNNNQSRSLIELDVRSTTNDSNAGDDTGGYMRFITKDEGDTLGERFVLTAKGRFKSNGRENLGGIRERTSGTLANGESVSWNGSGTTYTNAALNWNSMGGNGGGWIGCLSVTSADGSPSGAQVLVGVHGSGFNNYNMLQNSFDSGISVTPTGTGAGSNFWTSTISNTSGETVYYRMLVYHLGTLSSTVYGL